MRFEFRNQLIFGILGTTLALLFGCPRPGNQKNENLSGHEAEAISLDVWDPRRFVDREFPGEFDSSSGSLVVRTINGHRWLDMKDGEERIRVEVEFVSIAGHASNRTIQANSVPMSLNDVMSHALSIARVSQLDRTKLDSWLESDL